MNWEPRNIIDQEVEFPYRYTLKDINTGQEIATYDIVPTWHDNPNELHQQGTLADKAYLQPIEDFLALIADDLKAMGLEIKSFESDIINARNSQNIAIQDIGHNITMLENRMSTLAPLNAPELTNPTSNTVPTSDNSNRLATTAFTRQYLSSLFQAFNSGV